MKQPFPVVSTPVVNTFWLAKSGFQVRENKSNAIRVALRNMPLPLLCELNGVVEMRTGEPRHRRAYSVSRR